MTASMEAQMSQEGRIVVLEKTLGISLVAQMVKNLPVMQKAQETRAQFLGWEDSLEKEMATHSNTLA